MTPGSGTKLGFGASGPWAERWFSERKAYAVLRAASGLAMVDTGPSYAGGHAEARVGRLLARLSNEGGPALPVSSKVGTQIGEGGQLIKAFGTDAIGRQLDESLEALGRASLDVLYLHGPDERSLLSSLPFLTEQKELGRIGAVGVCCDAHHVGEAIAAPGVDWIMAPFNALSQRNGPGLLAAKAAGIKTCVVAPLAQGLWRRDLLLPRSLSGMWYAARAFKNGKPAIAAAREASWLREVPGWTPAALSVAFVRHAVAPDIILTTTTNPAHLRETSEAVARPIPADLAARLQGLIRS